MRQDNKQRQTQLIGYIHRLIKPIAKVSQWSYNNNPHELLLEKDANSNIRVFYYLLLMLCKESQNKQQVKQKFLEAVKEIHYCDFFQCSYEDKYFVDQTFKQKIHSLLTKIDNGQSLMALLCNQPEYDAIMLITMRILVFRVCKEHNYLDLNSRIDTRTIVLLFVIKIGINIVLNIANYTFKNTPYSIKEDNDYTYLLCHPKESNQDSIQIKQIEDEYQQQISPIRTPRFVANQIKLHTFSPADKNQKKFNEIQKSSNLLDFNARVVVSQQSISSVQGSPKSQYSDVIEKYEFMSRFSDFMIQRNLPNSQLKEQSYTSTKISTQLPECNLTTCILDGLTGDQVIKFMSPGVVKNMNQKKKQSMMTILNFNQKTTKKLITHKDTYSQCGEPQVFDCDYTPENIHKINKISDFRAILENKIKNQKRPKQTIFQKKPEQIINSLPLRFQPSNPRIQFTYSNPPKLINPYQLPLRR